MVSAVIEASVDGEIDMDPIVREATYALRQFMFDQVYTNSAAKAEEHKACLLYTSGFEYADSKEAGPEFKYEK